MTLSLTHITSQEFPGWFSQCANDYANDLVSAGATPDVARSQSEHSLSSAFPTGEPSALNAVFVVHDDATDQRVGSVWVGTDTSDDPASWWVWDITVDPAFRGQGFGRTSMQLAEDYARSQGAATLGLSVFGFNTAARGLYESLGYETTSVKMRKSLTPHG